MTDTMSSRNIDLSFWDTLYTVIFLKMNPRVRNLLENIKKLKNTNCAFSYFILYNYITVQGAKNIKKRL
jgi:hypothetical protein